MRHSPSRKRSIRPAELRRQAGSIWLKLLFVVVAWILVPLAIAEIGVRIWKPGFPGFSLPQMVHRPAEPFGFELVPNQRGFNVSAPVTINSSGFRGPELRARSGTGLRLLCVGDSFTFGYGVAGSESYPRQLERLLRESWPERDAEVVNAGVQGYATYHEMDFLESRGLKLQPDAVVLAVYHNDLEARPEGDYAPRYRRELAEAESTLRHRAPRLHWALQNSAALTLATQVYRSRQHTAAGDGQAVGEADGGDAVWRSMEEELRKFVKLSEEHGFFPLVLVIPSRTQLLAGNAESRYPGEVLSIAERLGLEAIDLRPVLSGAIEQGVDPYLAWDHHHGPEGNRRLAEAVRDRLARTALLRDPPAEAAPTAMRSLDQTAGKAPATERP